MSTWSQYSTSRRYSHLSKRDEVVSVEFGKGVCSYGDGPLHRIGLVRHDLPEVEFLASADIVLAALNAPKPTNDHAAAEADAIERRADRFARES